jgi:hypothetical protein
MIVPSSIIVVDLRIGSISPQTLFAAQVCSGLFNRANPQSVYLISQDEDEAWLQIVAPSLPSPPPTADVDTFINLCISSPSAGGVAKGRIRYSYSNQQRLVGNIATLASVLSAVPLEDSSHASNKTVISFDATTNWFNFSAFQATSYMYSTYANQTSTLCMMNPGLDVHGNPFDPSPPLSGPPDFSLTDFIVKEKLFTFFMVNACISGTDEGDLMEMMAASGPWSHPIKVYGYNDAYPIAGDIFEAETNCVKKHNMGQVATVGVTNLAFFSGSSPIVKPILQNPPNIVSFNASKTYLTLVVGDGDNIAMVKSSRFDWFKQRLSQCSSTSKCFPLAWTLSPHLLDTAPDILRWYYENSLSTGEDYFVLPPSGALYAYPASMEPDDQARFVSLTETYCTLMNTSATVAWEWLGTWDNAIKDYFPQYSNNRIVRSFFAVNVPYMVPIVEFATNEYLKVLNDSVILFKPNEWRGTSGGALEPPLMYNVSQMAEFINSWPIGTFSHIYMTSDGGAQLQDFVDLVPQLAEHIQVVDPESLSRLALESHILSLSSGK